MENLFIRNLKNNFGENLNIDLSIDEKEISIIIRDFINNYVENAGFRSVVIGLSGGVDSAVTALLCRDAIGKRNVKCLFFTR